MSDIDVEERVERLERALALIRDMGSKTLLGGGEMDGELAYQHGANAAFNQTADIARVALESSATNQ